MLALMLRTRGGAQGDDGAGAAAGGAGDGGEQRDMRGSLAERLHRAENAFDSLKRRASTDAYKELRTQHMQKAAENSKAGGSHGLRLRAWAHGLPEGCRSGTAQGAAAAAAGG